MRRAHLLAMTATALVALSARDSALSGQMSREGQRQSSARRAAALVGQNQTPDGYWIQPHTRQPAFREATVEMNTFLQAAMVDLLEPVASRAGLTEAVARTRRFLLEHIDQRGLARFLGRPDHPDAARLGIFEITPDVDSTSLLGRVTGLDDPRRIASAIASMKSFRTPEGLYRTWLAPPHEYKYIDPGADPNPVDVVNNAHVYLFLKRHDETAARDLCAPLQAAFTRDRDWPYYAPMMGVLREPVLAREGCPIVVTPARRTRIVPGQQVWMQAAESVVSLEVGGRTAADVAQLLDNLAADDFRAIRENPPMMFHNDPTATVPRFYWSIDAGYALWLRLYYAWLPAKP